MAISEDTNRSHRADAPTSTMQSKTIKNLAIGSPKANFISERIITGSPWKQTDANPTWTASTALGRMLEKPLATGMAREWADDYLGKPSILVSIGAKWWQLLPTTEKTRLITVGYRLPPIKPADTGA